MKKWILIAAITSSALSACCTTTGQPHLPLPDRPTRPSVFQHELTVLPTDVYRRLVIRERLGDEYTETLRNIIKSTH